MTIGLLSRETVAIAFFVALSFTFFTKANGSYKKTLTFILIPAAIGITWAAFVGVTYWGSALSNASFAAQVQPMSPLLRVWTWLYAIRLAFRPEILLLALVGFVRLRKSDVGMFKTAVAILIGSCVFLFLEPGVVDNRYAFVLFPVIIPMAAAGLVEISEYVSISTPVSTSRKRTIRLALELAFLLLYIAETNWVTRQFISYPWKPIIAPTSGNYTS